MLQKSLFAFTIIVLIVVSIALLAAEPFEDFVEVVSTPAVSSARARIDYEALWQSVIQPTTAAMSEYDSITFSIFMQNQYDEASQSIPAERMEMDIGQGAYDTDLTYDDMP